ncbi:amidohydrolase family protein, partial [Thermodesulfobacteriota bacterium]
MIIDCQTHVMPDDYIDIFARNTESTRMKRDSSGKAAVIVNDRAVLQFDMSNYSINKKIKDMDKLGIDISVLSPNIPGPCMLSPELALEGAQALNNFTAEAILKHPDRFAGIACLPWQNPREAIEEMNRAADSLGLCAVMLFSNIGGCPVDALEFEPVLA